MSPSARKLLIAALLCAFCLQSWMVYADPAGRTEPPLSPAGARGRALWHDHNCQSCHQLFGFGGFLGPDLTNAVEQLSEARIEHILTLGSGQMPAFELPGDERADLTRFLEEMSARGRGQARHAEWQPPGDLLAQVAGEDAPAPGLALALAQSCVACHLPNHASDYGAPDLTTAITRLGPQGVRDVLAAGVPGTAMPRFGFSEDDLDALTDFLTWMDRNGESIRHTFEVTRHSEGDWSVLDMPWWEF